MIDAMGDKWFKEADLKRKVGLTQDEWGQQAVLLKVFGYLLMKQRRKSQVMEYKIVLDHKDEIILIGNEIEEYEERLTALKAKKVDLEKKQAQLEKEDKIVEELVNDLGLKSEDDE